MRISDWSSAVCSADLVAPAAVPGQPEADRLAERAEIGLDAVQELVGVFDPLRRAAEAGADGAQEDQGGEGEPGRRVPHQPREHGRAPCRERVWTYVSLSVFAVSFTNNRQTIKT